MSGRGERRTPAASAVAGVGLALLTTFLNLGGCSGGPSPVGRLDASPSSLRLAYPEVSEVTLAWEPTGPLGPGLGGGADEAVVFVHLLDGAGKVVRTFDHPFPEAWRPGTPVADTVALYQSALAPPLPAGSYTLTVGLYRPGGARWPLEVAVADRGRHEYGVGRVEVPAPRAAGRPQFDFVGAWEPPMPGHDVQVLAYRWLLGEGAIIVGGPPGAGAVRLEFEIPEPDAPASVLVLAAEAPAPAVLVTTTCGDTMTQVTGAGHHALEVAVDPAAPALTGEGACEVRLAPNFYLIASDAPVRRAVALQVLAWRPADDGGAG